MAKINYGKSQKGQRNVGRGRRKKQGKKGKKGKKRLKKSAAKQMKLPDFSSLISPLHCNTCNVSFSGRAPLLQHLVSAKHKKKAAVLSTSSPEVDNTIIPLLQHLVSTKHKKEATVLSTTSPEEESNLMSNNSPVDKNVSNFLQTFRATLNSTNKESLLADNHFVKPSQENLIGQEVPEVSEDIIEAFEKGYIKENKKSKKKPYQCNLCHIPLTGFKPLKDHVKSAKHIKKASADSLHIGISSSTGCSFGISNNEMSTPQHQSAQPVNHKSIQGYIVGAPGSTTGPFQCKACDIVLTGLAPLEQHLTSAKHIKKLMASSYKENFSPNSSLRTTGTSLTSMTSRQIEQQLPEEIADILIVHANETLDNIF